MTLKGQWDTWEALQWYLEKKLSSHSFRPKETFSLPACVLVKAWNNRILLSWRQPVLGKHIPCGWEPSWEGPVLSGTRMNCWIKLALKRCLLSASHYRLPFPDLGLLPFPHHFCIKQLNVKVGHWVQSQRFVFHLFLHIHCLKAAILASIGDPLN